MNPHSVAVEDLLAHHKEQVLSEWQAELRATGGGRDLHSDSRETSELLEALLAGLRASGGLTDLDAAGWSRLRDLLARLSASRAAQGATAADTSRFVLALKKPLFGGLQRAFSSQPDLLFAATWEVSTLLDAMAQHTVSAYQRTREDIIARQQQDLLELSTPVVKLWEGVLAVPMIGTLDSGRTQIVMEALLERIVETGSALAIIDITGVPTVDTLVAQHLMKTVTAIRLMGADCIISGIRPQIAQTIVHLGIDLEGITTKASLADALSLALRRTGYVITRNRGAAEVVSGRMD
ncbi:STAS domain-containing protein [Roseateles depolymerans]|uniref:Putative signal transduction protein n=1 Tax=Roseateles depolymerans TaxID=76731 RepID=A0A0U3NDL3_9BURK|nr:STAS domain-containing protein [Roseateles depolymerans]ALV06560.1 putative signal transduction protein [Roseateles depolymerans]REG19535.1 rsbT co-antagonist protein RsbR [Roseateles depolymerans]